MPTLTLSHIITIALLGTASVLYYFYYLRAPREVGSKDDKTATILTKFTHDLTAEAQNKKIDPVIGRSAEIERVIHILARRSKNNPLLIGEPGVGKTAIVEGIATRMATGDVPACLKGKRVLSLDLGGLISGTKYRGEFEERMKKLTDEIKGMARTVVLFIDEIHMIEQARGAEGAMNVSDILKPALSRGELQAIGATTWKEYEEYIRPDDALNRRFQPVVVGEPNPADALEIIRGIKSAYETHHGVVYEDNALKASVDLSKKYIKDRYLPDKAIDLIDEAGAKVSIQAARSTHHAIGVLHAAGKSVRQRLAHLDQQGRSLKKEIASIKVMEKGVPDPSVVIARKKLEETLETIEIQKKLIHGGKKQGAPRVTTADIQAVVADWTGRHVATRSQKKSRTISR